MLPDKYINVMVLKKWNDRQSPIFDDLITFWNKSEEQRNGPWSSLVICRLIIFGKAYRRKVLMFAHSDGTNASGLYLALGYVLENMKLDQLVDVDWAIRKNRHHNNRFVQNLVNFIVHEYINNQNCTYRNNTNTFLMPQCTSKRATAIMETSVSSFV